MLIPHRIEVTDYLRLGGKRTRRSGSIPQCWRRTRSLWKPAHGRWRTTGNRFRSERRRTASGGISCRARCLPASGATLYHGTPSPPPDSDDVYLATPLCRCRPSSHRSVCRSMECQGPIIWPIDGWSVQSVELLDPRNDGRSLVSDKTVPVLSTHGFIHCEYRKMSICGGPADMETRRSTIFGWSCSTKREMWRRSGSRTMDFGPSNYK